jgi:uncharacterized membrane protein
MAKVEDFLTASEEEAIIEAIRVAEKNTSGEIRVHIEAHSKIDAFDRAAEVFDFLRMSNTKLSNGVLIYVAVEDRTLVILGDSGINDVVPPQFWESTKDAIIHNFKNENVGLGLIEGIHKAGEQLKKHFPYKTGDSNELSDEISVG